MWVHVQYVPGEMTACVCVWQFSLYRLMLCLVRLVKSPSGFRKNGPQQEGNNNNYLLVGKQASLTFSVGDKVPKKTRQSKPNNLFTHTGETESTSCSCWWNKEQISLSNGMIVSFVRTRWDCPGYRPPVDKQVHFDKIQSTFHGCTLEYCED